MRFGSLYPFHHRHDDPFVAFRREMDRMFDAFARGLPDATQTGSEAGLWAPCINVEEDEAGVNVTAELPGVDHKDIECTLADGVLTIKGEKKAEREEKRKDYHIAERAYGSFYRAIPLPFAVQEDRVEASFDKGVLRLHLPKSPEAMKAERKIAIKTAQSGQSPKAA